MTAKKSKESARPNLGRHQSNCSICAHPLRAEIERDFVSWGSPGRIATAYKLGNRASVYRHAHALGLFSRRARSLRCAIERIIERIDEVEFGGAAIIQAIVAHGKINKRGQFQEPDDEDLFEQLSTEELKTYITTGTHPDWFREALVAAGVRLTDGDDDDDKRRRLCRGPRPGDFPLGSLRSRAAARSLLQAREQEARMQRAARIGNLTTAEEAFIAGIEKNAKIDDPRVRELLIRIYRETIVERNKVFGVPLPHET